MPSKRELLGLLLLCPVCALGLPDEDRLLSAAEIASVDRENAMWRLARVEDDAATNLRFLRSRGFTAEEVDLLQPRLTDIWEVKLERNYGWISKETIERVQTVDRGFIVRLRAARLYAATGIRAGSKEPEKLVTVGRDWLRAIQRELDPRELAEFRLMNSRSANKITKLVKELAVSIDEFRTLCEWQREFDGVHGFPDEITDRSRSIWHGEAQLEHWSRIREHLGDRRFAVFLSRADQSFNRMNQVIGQLDGGGPSLALDLWWLGKKNKLALSRVKRDKAEAERLEAEHEAKAAALLGPARYEGYERYQRWVWSGKL